MLTSSCAGVYGHAASDNFLCNVHVQCWLRACTRAAVCVLCAFVRQDLSLTAGGMLQIVKPIDPFAVRSRVCKSLRIVTHRYGLLQIIKPIDLFAVCSRVSFWFFLHKRKVKVFKQSRMCTHIFTVSSYACPRAFLLQAVNESRDLGIVDFIDAVTACLCPCLCSGVPLARLGSRVPHIIKPIDAVTVCSVILVLVCCQWAQRCQLAWTHACKFVSPFLMVVDLYFERSHWKETLLRSDLTQKRDLAKERSYYKEIMMNIQIWEEIFYSRNLTNERSYWIEILLDRSLSWEMSYGKRS